MQAPQGVSHLVSRRLCAMPNLHQPTATYGGTGGGKTRRLRRPLALGIHLYSYQCIHRMAGSRSSIVPCIYKRQHEGAPVQGPSLHLSLRGYYGQIQNPCRRREGLQILCYSMLASWLCAKPTTSSSAKSVQSLNAASAPVPSTTTSQATKSAAPLAYRGHAQPPSNSTAQSNSSLSA